MATTDEQASMLAHLAELRARMDAARKSMEQTQLQFQQLLQEYERSMQQQAVQLAALQQEEQQLLARLQEQQAAAAQAAVQPQANGVSSGAQDRPRSRPSSGQGGMFAAAMQQVKAQQAQQAQQAQVQAAGAPVMPAPPAPAAPASQPPPGPAPAPPQQQNGVSPMQAQFAHLLPGFQAAQPAASGPAPAPVPAPAVQQQQGQGQGHQEQGAAREFVPRAVQLSQPAAAREHDAGSGGCDAAAAAAAAATPQQAQRGAARRPPPGFGAVPAQLPPGFGAAATQPPPGFGAPAAQQQQQQQLQTTAQPGRSPIDAEMVEAQLPTEQQGQQQQGQQGQQQLGDEEALQPAEADPARGRRGRNRGGGEPYQPPGRRSGSASATAPKQRLQLGDEEGASSAAASRPGAPGSTGTVVHTSSLGPLDSSGEAAAHAAAAAGTGWGAAAAAGPVSQGYEDLLEGFYLPPEAPEPEWASKAGGAEEAFPSLGAPAPAGGAAGGAAGTPWGSKWGSGGLRDKLLKQAEGPSVARPLPPPSTAAAASAGAAAALAVEEVEVKCGLRVVGDATPDLQRRRQVRRSTFEHVELVGKRPVNVAEGLELHESILSPAEQAHLVDTIEHWVGLGRAGALRGRTFSAPRKWLPGKGRMTIQFGCCYNYAKDDQGREPGIIPEEIVEPMPPQLRALCRRLTRWGVLPRATEPDSAIINIYEEGDCIPPHIDHKQFLRPFCTLSLVSQQPIMFSKRLLPLGPGEFGAPDGVAPALIPLPTGSCLVLKGFGGDDAMHCVPPVSSRRVSITLRCMGRQHRAAVQQEIKKFEAEHGPLRPFWVEEKSPSGRSPWGAGYVSIK